MADIIEHMILDSWKRQGGIYKQVAEEVERDLEREELDAIERPVAQDRIAAEWGVC